MSECLFARAEEVQELLGVSRAEAYRIIKKLNAELEQQGYIVILSEQMNWYKNGEYWYKDVLVLGIKMW